MKIPNYNKKIKHPTYLKMQEEIERLKEEYVMLQNASDEVEEEKGKEIGRLTAESTKWESKFYDEAKKVDRAIGYITYKSVLGEKGLELNLCDKQIEKLLDILKGSDKE